MFSGIERHIDPRTIIFPHGLWQRIIVLNPIVLDQVTLEKVDTTNFLGVLIDDKLTWLDHIDAVKTKVSKS